MSPANLTLRQLRAFQWVVQTQSMTRAAERLHLTPSALSMLIRSLEEEVGLRLFERTTRRLVLTEAGRLLAGRAEQILAGVDEAVLSLQQMREQQQERLTLATSPLLAASLMPAVIAAFRAEFPNVAIALRDVPVDQVAGLVLRGEADIGLCTADGASEGLHAEVLLRDALMLACPADHPLAARGEVRWSDLLEWPLILLRSGSGTRSLIDKALARWGSALQPAFEVANISTAVGLVNAGLGVSVLPAYSLARASSQTLVARPLTDPVVSREIVALSRPQVSTGAASQALLAHIRQSPGKA